MKNEEGLETGDESARSGRMSASHRPSAAATAGTGKGAARSADDLWLLLIEFALSQRVWWTEVCGAFDLTPTQGLVMRLLDPRTPLAMNALAEAMVCDASNVTGVVDKLEARGLIVRQAVENDRRVKHLAVTDRGRELRRKLFAAAAKPPEPIAKLSRDSRDKLSGVLRALLAERGTSAAASDGS